MWKFQKCLCSISILHKNFCESRKELRLSLIRCKVSLLILRSFLIYVRRRRSVSNNDDTWMAFVSLIKQLVCFKFLSTFLSTFNLLFVKSRYLLPISTLVLFFLWSQVSAYPFKQNRSTLKNTIVLLYTYFFNVSLNVLRPTFFNRHKLPFLRSCTNRIAVFNNFFTDM